MQKFWINNFRKLMKTGVMEKPFTKINVGPILGKNREIGDYIQEEASKWEENLWNEWQFGYRGIDFSMDTGLMLNMTSSGSLYYLDRNLHYSLKKISLSLGNLLQQLQSLSDEELKKLEDALTSFSIHVSLDDVRKVNHLNNLIEAESKLTRERDQPNENIKRIPKRVERLLYKFQPQMLRFETEMKKVKDGKNEELEDLLFTVAREASTENFLRRLDEFVTDIRSLTAPKLVAALLNFSSKSLRELFEVTNTHGTDVDKLSFELKNALQKIEGRFSDYVTGAIDSLERFLTRNDEIFENQMKLFQVFHPCQDETSQEFCEGNLLLLYNHWETFAGGLLRMYVKTHQSYRTETIYKTGEERCQVHCDQECPQKKQQYSTDDFQTYHCYSPRACVKSFIFDSECK